jgi:hypothetical protein
LIGGAATPIRVTDGPLGRGIFATGGGLNVLSTGIAPGGALLPADVNGALVLARGGQLRVTGTGFAPGSTATLTLSTDPITLGSATADPSGAISALVPVPADVAIGNHTLNLIAKSASGQQAIVTLGVRVLSPAAAMGARPVIRVRALTVAPGKAFTVRARGVQAQCLVRFSVPGSSARATASAGGLASASLTAPSSTGRRTVTARVSGAGCEPVTVTTTIRVRKN